MEIEELIKIMESLREKCPWDKKQTSQSLRPYLIEEAYEVIEAIEEKDPEKIKEELGDLLFQIVFHARIAKERGEFEFKDIVSKVSEKMISRHPHVFGEAKYATAEEVVSHWEAQKKKEGKLRESLLDGVPKDLPSLLRAHRLQDRASKVGFDWHKVEDVVSKLDEEVGEFKESLESANKDEMEEEMGDMLFMLVNISRFVGVNPESALRKTVAKFIDRFGYIEKKAKERGVRLQDMGLDEMDRLWEEAKKG